MGASLNKTQDKSGVTSFKILVVGASQSGKTSIIQRYTSNQFRGNHEPTRLLKLTTHTLRVPGRHLVPMSVTFWEIPSNPLPSMKEKYYSKADGVLVVIDASIPEVNLVQDAMNWKEDISSLCENQYLPFMILINKMEQTRLRRVDITELREASEDNGFVTCVEVFPQSGGESVFSAVDGLLRLLVDKGRFYHRESFYPTAPSQTDVVDVTISSMDYVLPSDVQLTGIQEQDRLICLCWRQFGLINQCSSALQKGVTNFEKESLHENVITKQHKRGATIEHCIAGLRERLPSSCELHVICNSSSEFTFPQLKITDKCLFKCEHEVLKLLYIYHTEIYPPGMQLFQDIPEVQVHIKRCKESLSKLQESEEDKEGAVGSVAASKVADAIVKVESWEREIENVWKKVKMLSQRIQVAALWNSGTTVSEK